jgi:NAD(P)-dependent dehydrogenase (short-subunit alcohol dehydrogenase family)
MPRAAAESPGDLGLAGAAIIVTGASSGIGAATAAQLGADGADVVLVGRREAQLRAQAEVVVRAGGQAVAVPADLAEPGSPALIASACRDRFGRIDGVVNNAAVVRHKPLADWEVAGFDEHVATNVRGPYFLVQAALPDLTASPVRSVVTSAPLPGPCTCPGSPSTA